MANDFKRGIRVYLETSDYGKGIDAMVAATKKYETELSKLTEESKKMTAAGQNSGKNWDDLQKKIKAHEVQLKKSQTAEADYRVKLQQTEKVLNNLSGVSYNELIKMKQQLTKELRDEAQGTDRYNKILAQSERVSKQVAIAQKDMTTQIGCQGSAWGKAADFINKYWVMITGFIGIITGASLTFRKLAEDIAKMDDVYSDVMKTTNLTKKQVIELNEQFKVMDTRTARENLNKLASDAGKLGIDGSKNILDFVDAGNQINVALGEDLGEDAIKNIGKLTQTFAKSTKELEKLDLRQKMLSIGSAINTIGQSSTAQESYLVEFAQRVSGAFSQAGISLQDTLGYASALDQAGQGIEMSATAVQQFVMKMFSDPAKFAKIAGIEVKAFNKLLKEDTNTAILTVLKSLSEKGGFAQLVPIFDQMGLDGARAVGVLSSLASNINLVTEAQALSNKSFNQGTSITKEYNIKNENLAARLAKARKEFSEMALKLGESLNPALLTSTKWTTYLVKGLASLPEFLKENLGLLIRITAALVAYTLVANGKLLLDKAEAIATGIKILGLRLRIALTNQASEAELRLLKIQNLSNESMKRNLWGLLAAAIAFAIVYLIEWIEKNNEASASSKIFNGIIEDQKELIRQNSQKILEEKNNLEGLVTAIVSTNDNSALRSKLISELKDKYPGFISFIDSEKLSNQMLLAALKDVNDQYSIKIQNAALIGKAEAFDSAAVKAAQRRIEIEEEIKKLSRENTEDARERVKELNKEDLQLQRNMKAYQQHSTKYRSEANLNDQEIKRMNTAGYAQSQIKVWYNAAKDFEAKYKDARDKGLTDQAKYYQKQMQQANSYVEFYKIKRDELAEIERLKSKDKDDDSPTSGENLSDEQRSKLAAKEKKAVDAAIKAQETEHFKELSAIKERYVSGDIKTEFDYNQELLKQQNNYSDKRKEILEQLLKTVSSQDVRNEIKNQLAEIDKQDIDRRIDHLNQIKKILLDADPSALENASYDDRLRQLGLFGIKKENMTREQLDVMRILEIQHSNNLQAIAAKADNLKLKAQKDISDAGIKALETGETTKLLMLKDALSKKLITQKEYDEEEKRLAVELVTAKLALAEANLKAIEAIDFVSKENRDDALAAAKLEIEVLKNALISAGIDLQNVSGKLNKDISAQMQSIFGNSFSSIGGLFANFSKSLDALKKGDLKSWTDWGSAIGGIVEGALVVASEISDQYFEYKAAAMEADKQLELTNAGDNAEAREAINQKYAQKELDLKKKQSSADTVLKVAQAVAAGGLAIVQAFAQLGPIGGAIAAVLVGGITALQVATIVKQNAAIQATTLDSSTQGAGGLQKGSGALVATPQAVNGRWDVIGEEDGRVYRNVPYRGVARTGIVSTPTLMGEQGDEIVIDNPTTRNIIMNAPWIVGEIMRYRVPQRAGGKYDAIGTQNADAQSKNDSNTAIYAMIIEMISKNNALLEYLKENGVDTIFVIDEFEKLIALRDKSKKKGSL